MRKLDADFYPGCGSYDPVDLVEVIVMWWYHFHRSQQARYEGPTDEESFVEACRFLYRHAVQGAPAPAAAPAEVAEG